jgi:DNA-binding beta-propeller fold protein YncE
MSRRVYPALAMLVVAEIGCAPARSSAPAHSSSIAINAQGTQVFVVNADADSVSVLDVRDRSLTREILLAAAPPTPAADGSYTPSVMPRALALSADEQTLYVTGQRSGRIYAIALSKLAVTASAEIGSEPIGIVTSADGASVFVACSQDNEVVKLNASTLAIQSRVSVDATPWALAWSADGTRLLVSHLLGPGVTTLEPSAMKVRATWPISDVPARGDRRLAHGQARGLYDLASRPYTNETWVAHTLLGTDTAQPELDFESTVFPALSVLLANGALVQTLSTDSASVPGIDGAFGDIVSGPRAIAFTSDGRCALMLDASSEDVLLVDASNRVQVGLLRPLPGHFPEGIAISADGRWAYIDQRGSSDVAVVKLTTGGVALGLEVDGRPIFRLQRDPMPAKLRLGQHLFYSANSDEYPLTTNHWVSCSSCHLEGRSDAVTWKFFEGPRDTPSNAGGMRGTGFLFRTAERREVADYWRTINIEQGGSFDPDDAATAGLLEALSAYVNLAIPLPVPPTTQAELVTRGKQLFERADVGCSSCHPGPRLTDSGQGNPTLDLGSAVLLHDVGTCAAGDLEHPDIEGHSRERCQFDTPSLSGLSSSPPYLHDGSAATLRDVLERTRGKMGDISSLSAADVDALLEYLRSL